MFPRASRERRVGIFAAGWIQSFSFVLVVGHDRLFGKPTDARFSPFSFSASRATVPPRRDGAANLRRYES